MTFDEAEIVALREMVRDWIGEGFTTPPYSPAQYAIFEKMSITNEKDPNGGYELSVSYDIQRP